jgi:hypothetical protein
VSISLGYTYHPMPILTELQPDTVTSSKRKKSSQTTPTIEEDKADHQDITETLLKVALNTITHKKS